MRFKACGLGVSAIVVSGLAALTPAASAHRVTPASGAHPLITPAGAVLGSPDGSVHFGCQTTVPAGCYGPDQIRAAYNVQPLLDSGIDGAGRTIVIIDAFQSPSLLTDLGNFDTLWGLPTPTVNIIAPDGVPAFDPGNADMVNWSGEITLDVEWSHAIAPGATIDLVESRSDQDADILSATQYAVDSNLGDVISQSFGEGESCMSPALLQAEHAVFAQAVAQGTTLFASAGDQGSAQPNCFGGGYFKSVSTPASDPLVTSVGGTRLVADGTSGDYQSEDTWNEFDSFGAVGGGGFSHVYRRPGWQKGFNSLRWRGVPDVSYNGAIIGGVLTNWMGAWYRFGGTSAGSPQWAAITALADQLKGKRLGSINKSLYRIASSGSPALSFHDVTTGNNAFGDIDGWNAVAGWDAATGLGSPNAQNVVAGLASRHPHL